jgi:hypothetical protein
MDTFDLHIVHGHRIDTLILCLQQPVGKTMFVLLFDMLNITHEGFIIDQILQFLQFIQITDPTLSDFLRMKGIHLPLVWRTLIIDYYLSNGITKIGIA